AFSFQFFTRRGKPQLSNIKTSLFSQQEILTSVREQNNHPPYYADIYPIQNAALNGDLAGVQAELDKGVDVKDDKGRIPLD
ncbi:MAG: hypothetical protein QF437_34200, partial [Planctomycetota bacterium]|nr:hypothetical protein [Planctomycetota bacterium]